MHQTFATDQDLADEPPVSRFLSSLSGWVLRPLLQLDRHRPGVLADVLSARPRKRQAIYAALSAGALKRPQEFAAVLGPSPSWHGAIWPALLAEALLTVDPAHVLAVAFGSSPDGLLTLLARAGPAPLQHGSYARLHAIFADPAQRRRRQVLSDADTLTDDLLDIVEVLPVEALRPAGLSACRKLADAHTLAFAIELSLQRGRTRVQVAKQISDMGAQTSLFSLVCKLLGTFDCAPRVPDLSSIPGAVVLASSKALKRAGGELENCLASFAVAWATTMGETVYAVLRNQHLIAQLHFTSAGWLLTGVHRPANVDVSADDRKLACAIFEGAGFATLAVLHRSDDAQRAGEMLDAVQARVARRLG